MKKIALLSIGLLLAGCGPEMTKDVQKREVVFQNPGSNAIDVKHTAGHGNINFVPINARALPRGAKNIRFEGNGWYTFLWRGGCYIASAQDSGQDDFEIRITTAHSKQVCDLTERKDPPPQDYEHYDSQQTTQY